MAEKVQQLNDSQDYKEQDLLNDWNFLEPSVSDELKDNQLTIAFENLDTNIDLETLVVSEKNGDFLGTLNKTLYDLPQYDASEDTKHRKELLETPENAAVNDCLIEDIHGDADDQQTVECNVSNLDDSSKTCSQTSENFFGPSVESSKDQISLAKDDHSAEKGSSPKSENNQKTSLPSSGIDEIECNNSRDNLIIGTSGSDKVKITDPDECETGTRVIPNDIKSVKSPEGNQTIAEDQSDLGASVGKLEKEKSSKVPVKYKPQFGKKKLNQTSEALPQTSHAASVSESPKVSTPSSSVVMKSAKRTKPVGKIPDCDGSITTDSQAAQTKNFEFYESVEPTQNAESVLERTGQDGATKSNDQPGQDGASKSNDEQRLPSESCELEKSTENSAENNEVSVKTKKKRTSKVTKQTQPEPANQATQPTGTKKKRKQTSKAKGENLANGNNSTSASKADGQCSKLRYFLENQEQLAQARNAIRRQKQKEEMNCAKESNRNLNTVNGTASEQLTERDNENKVKELDREIAILEALVDQVTSLTEGEQDHDKSLLLFSNINEKVSTSFLIKHPVIVAVLEPVQRYTSNERIKGEAENLIRKFNSMFVKQDMEDFVFVFDRALKGRQRYATKSDRVVKKVMTKVFESESHVDLDGVTFDKDMWDNLQKERSNIWQKFMQMYGKNNDVEPQNVGVTDQSTSNLKEEHDNIKDIPGTANSFKYHAKVSSAESKHLRVKAEPTPAAAYSKKNPSEQDTGDSLKQCSASTTRKIKQETASIEQVITYETEMVAEVKSKTASTTRKTKQEITSNEQVITNKTEMVSEVKSETRNKAAQRKQLKRRQQKPPIIIKKEIPIIIKKEIVSDDESEGEALVGQRRQPRRRCKAGQMQSTVTVKTEITFDVEDEIKDPSPQRKRLRRRKCKTDQHKNSAREDSPEVEAWVEM